MSQTQQRTSAVLVTYLIGWGQILLAQRTQNDAPKRSTWFHGLDITQSIQFSTCASLRIALLKVPHLNSYTKWLTSNFGLLLSFVLAFPHESTVASRFEFTALGRRRRPHRNRIDDQVEVKEIQDKVLEMNAENCSNYDRAELKELNGEFHKYFETIEKMSIEKKRRNH